MNAFLWVFEIVLLTGAALTPRVPLWCRAGFVLCVGGGLLNDTPAEGYDLGLETMGLGVFLGGLIAISSANRQVFPPQISPTKSN
jgi:hypothetical protein